MSDRGMEMAPGAIRPRDEVRAMFDRIVPRYDLMNRLMTGWRDVAWRKRAVREALNAGPPPALLSALDVATGTGDLALALRDAGAGDVVGLDFAPAMIDEALRKDAASGRLPRIGWVEGDAMAMPFANESFDVVTVAFGLRNMPDYRAALREMARVLRPGGLLVCLETTPHPWPPVRWLVDWFLARALPFLGGRLAGDADAYAYLPASTAAFPDAETLGRMMLAAGFARARYLRLGLGTVALHVAAMPTLETGIGDFSA